MLYLLFYTLIGCGTCDRLSDKADSVLLQAVVAHRFSMLLLALIPRSSDGADAQLVVHLALAAWHPVVSPVERSARARPLWTHIRRRLPAAPAALAGGCQNILRRCLQYTANCCFAVSLSLSCMHACTLSMLVQSSHRLR